LKEQFPEGGTLNITSGEAQLEFHSVDETPLIKKINFPAPMVHKPWSDDQASDDPSASPGNTGASASAGSGHTGTGVEGSMA
jgi:hypothetical protein